MGTVAIDSGTEYQTWKSFECTIEVGEGDPTLGAQPHNAWFDNLPLWRETVQTAGLSDMALSRIRLECRQILFENSKELDADFLDLKMQYDVSQYLAAAAALGITPTVNLCFVGFVAGRDTPSLADDPTSYAALILAAFQRLDSLYGIVPDMMEVILEPDNANANWTATQVATNLVAAAQTLAAAGYTPEFIAPSCLNMDTSLSMASTIAAYPGALTYWKECSYHRYGGTPATTLPALASFAAANGLRTSHLEYINADYTLLHADLSVANVAAWQQYTLCFPAADTGAQTYYITNATTTPVVNTAATANRLWQYQHYLQPGAVRLGASSDDTSHYDPVCFRNTTGKYIVVLKCAAGATEPLSISGLPAGEYGITYTDADSGHKTLGNQTVATGGTLTLDHSFTGPLTVYQLTNPGVTTMASIKYEAAAIVSIATTELNALANGSGALGAEYDNGTNLYTFGLFELNVTWGSSPTAGALVNLYLIPAPDGTNYDDNTTGGSPYAPQPCYVGGFPAQASTSAQKIPLGVTGYQALVPLPPCKFKAFLINNSGQAFPANGSTLKMIPYRTQVV